MHVFVCMPSAARRYSEIYYLCIFLSLWMVCSVLLVTSVCLHTHTHIIGDCNKILLYILCPITAAFAIKWRLKKLTFTMYISYEWMLKRTESINTFHVFFNGSGFWVEDGALLTPHPFSLPIPSPPFLLCFFCSMQKSAPWTAARTECAWGARVAAKRAGQAPPAARGPATRAAPSTARARMASASAARAGTESTAPSVSTAPSLGPAPALRWPVARAAFPTPAWKSWFPELLFQVSPCCLGGSVLFPAAVTCMKYKDFFFFYSLCFAMAAKMDSPEDDFICFLWRCFHWILFFSVP